MDLLSVVNAALALSIFLAAVCAVDKMQRGTSHTMRMAVILVLAGALGECIAPWTSGGWQAWIDTLFFGGVAAFLFADRRGPFAPPLPLPEINDGSRLMEDAGSIVHERQATLAAWAQRVSAAISLCTVALLLATWGGAAHAKAVLRLALNPQVSIVLYDDRCALPELQAQYLRAVWTENGQPVEGCWTFVRLGGGLVALYWADKTLSALPAAFFTRVEES